MRLNTRALATATAVTCSAAVFGVTLLFLVGPGDASSLEPLSGLLFGYSASVAGAFIGGLWAYAYGFLAGGLVAFTYNVVVVPPPPSLEEEG